MKRFYKLLLPAIAVIFVLLMAGFGGGDNTDYPVGAPPGYTNSPFDGKNCTHCMGGSAVPLADMIASDIPASGYVKGTTYNIVVTATGAGNKGLELSPQDVSGNLLGTLITGPETKLVGDGKYITHKLASEDNTMSWSFQWQAPAVGVGPITFYASVVIGKLNTKTTTLIAPQSTLGMEDPERESLMMYPNPATDRLNVSFSTRNADPISLEVYSISGRKISELFHGLSVTGEQTMTFPIDFAAGIYLLSVQSEGKTQVQRFVVL
ncbi:MAG: T9SS type A sorting domain-containing protein [Bacteroidales bacterium]|nr:T9SS type A sorting domain-containing protein [Bacteroidales bacterium]